MAVAAIIDTAPVTAPPYERHARLFLLRLGQAVQRASIYPPGHPAVSQGVGPLIDALHDLVADGPVTIAIGRTRLLVSAGGGPPSEHESPWLAARLFERQLTSLTIDARPDPGDVARLVTWLSATDAAAGEWSESGGIALSRFDARHLRFREGPSRAKEPAETLAAWHALFAPLRNAYNIDDEACRSGDPAVLAERIRHSLHASEGTGIARLSAHLIELHGRTGALDADTKAIVLAKLAGLVNGLAEELRGTLLSTGPDDHPSKLRMLEDLLPHLSASTVSHVAASIGLGRGLVQGPYARFLKKLAHAAAADPGTRDILERRAAAAGVPPELVFGDGDDGDRADRAHPTTPVAGEFVPEEYGAGLQQLADGEVRPADRAPRVPVETFEPSALDDHLAEIALLHLRADLTGPGAVACLRRLVGLLPAQRERRALPLLIDAADVVLRLRARRATLPPELAVWLSNAEEFLAERHTVAIAIEAITAHPLGSGDLSATLLLAGGAGAVSVALDWLKTAAESDARARVAGALAALDLDLFRTAVAPALDDHQRAAEALASILDRVDRAHAVEIAQVLASHRCLEVRRQAIDFLLRTPLGAARLQRVLQRAFEDPDLSVLRLALDAAAHRRTGDLGALVSFVARRSTPELADLQARAVWIVADYGADGLNRLIGPLRQRHRAVGAADRRLALAIAWILRQSPLAGPRAAARAWRWSPAGWLSAMLFTQPATPSS